MAYLGNAPTSVPLSSADLQDGIITTAKIANGAVIGADINSTFDLTGKTVTLPAGTGGKVLQVVQTTKTNTFSTSSSTAVNITGLSVSITPSSASNKILILCSVNTNNAVGYNRVHLAITGGNASTYKGDASGSGQRISMTTTARNTTDSHFQIPATLVYLDSPSTTSATTYQVTAFTDGGTVNINTVSSVDANTGLGASTITVMEIAG